MHVNLVNLFVFVLYHLHVCSFKYQNFQHRARECKQREHFHFHAKYKSLYFINYMTPFKMINGDRINVS